MENNNENCQKRENNKKIKQKSQKETQLFLCRSSWEPSLRYLVLPPLLFPRLISQVRPNLLRFAITLQEERDQNISPIDMLLPFFPIDSLIKKE